MEDVMENPKLMMMVAAGKALDYKNRKPFAGSNEIIQNIVMDIKANGNAKISAIAAANRALKYKEENPKALDKEIMQKVMNETTEIIESIE